MQTKNALPKNFDSQIKQVTVMAMTILHNPENKIEENQLPDAYNQAMETAQHQEDAGPQAAAEVAMWVFNQVERSILSKGKKLPPVVLLGAMNSIVTQVAELAEAAMIFTLSEEDMQIAMASAVNMLVAKARRTGSVSDQQLKEAAQALQKKYPQEAENFKKMVQARQQRLSSSSPNQEPPASLLQGKTQSPPPAATGQQPAPEAGLLKAQ